MDKSTIKSGIYEHPEFTTFIAGMNAHFAAWRETSAETLKALKAGCHPNEVVAALSECLLAHYARKPLIDPYDVYQHLMSSRPNRVQSNRHNGTILQVVVRKNSIRTKIPPRFAGSVGENIAR